MMNDQVAFEDVDENDSTFSCRIDSVKTISDILQCLCTNNVKKDQPCFIEATSESLIISVTGL